MVISRPSLVFAFTVNALFTTANPAYPELGVVSTLNVLPVKVNPSPAKYVPAPENCVKLISSVPIIAGFFVCTQPVDA